LQTHRTIAIIKALGAIAPAIVSRQVYYAGAKHLIPILQLLIPGIDLVRLLRLSRIVTYTTLQNDPSKTVDKCLLPDRNSLLNRQPHSVMHHGLPS
jgi:hypothetical protein